MLLVRWLVFLFFVLPVGSVIAVFCALALYALVLHFGWYLLLAPVVLMVSGLICYVIDEHGFWPWKTSKSERGTRGGV